MHNNKQICKKISSMLSLYIDNRVTSQERIFIEEHLSVCENCYKKYVYLKSLIKDLKDSYKSILELSKRKQQQKIFRIREHEKFLDSLYPYIDNELDVQECIDFRNYLVKSPSAQRQLKNVYVLQKELRSAFDNTQQHFSKDLSPRVIDAVKQQRERVEFRKRVMFKNSTFGTKFVKVAILSGLVFLGGYEIDQLYKLSKVPVSVPKNQNNTTIFQDKKYQQELFLDEKFLDNISE